MAKMHIKGEARDNNGYSTCSIHPYTLFFKKNKKKPKPNPDLYIYMYVCGVGIHLLQSKSDRTYFAQ